MLFNEQGILNMDEMLVERPSFQKIMNDGLVTEDELFEQSEKVLAMLRETEKRFNEEDQLFINNLFAEANVLSAVYHYYQLQNLK